jgi:hypothetical protein
MACIACLGGATITILAAPGAWSRAAWPGRVFEDPSMVSRVTLRYCKDPHGPVLAFGPQDWQRFADRV